jgi:hypothetical protein
MRLTLSTFTHPQRGPQHSVLLEGRPVMATTDSRSLAEQVFRDLMRTFPGLELFAWDGDTATLRPIATFYDLRRPAVAHPVGTIN